MGTRSGSGFIGVLLIGIAVVFFGACSSRNITGTVLPDNPYGDIYRSYPEYPYTYGNPDLGTSYSYRPYDNYYSDAYGANSDYYYNDGYRYDRYGYYDEFGYYDSYGNLLYNPNDAAYLNLVQHDSRSYDPFMQRYSYIDDRSVSQYVNSTYTEMLTDFGGSLQDLLVELDGSSFYINPGEYTLATRNAVLSEGGDLESSLVLTSSYDGVSLASYTLEEFFGSEQLAELSVEGSGSFSSSSRSGLYIGIRQYGDRDTRWFGPYRNGMDWEVRPLKWDDRYISRHCFITLAVFGGDSVTVNRLHAEVEY